MKNKLVTFITIVFLAFSALVANAKEQIKVGGYHYPPYLDLKNDRGLSLEVIQLLNELQSDYSFVFVETSANRRYKDIVDGNYDIILFEDRNWGWEKFLDQVKAGPVIARDLEKFITKKIDIVDQSYFDDITSKQKIAILGYHYKYANFNVEPKVLKTQYLTELTNSHEVIFKSVSEGRKDIGLIGHSSLKYYLKDKPKLKESVLISKKYDQKHQLRFIFRVSEKLKVEEIAKLFKRLKNHPKYQSLLKKYHVSP